MKKEYIEKLSFIKGRQDMTGKLTVFVKSIVGKYKDAYEVTTAIVDFLEKEVNINGKLIDELYSTES